MSELTIEDLNVKVQRNQDLLTSEVDGETVMMSVEDGSYYGINKIGTRIWELMDVPIAVKELCTNLVQEYKIEQEACEQEVLSFLNQMIQEKMIDLS